MYSPFFPHFIFFLDLFLKLLTKYIIAGADFTAAKGIAALVNEFVSRKQPLYFVNPREEVITVFKGAVRDDFQYFASESDMDECLKSKY